jgi:hypothetical protein
MNLFEELQVSKNGDAVTLRLAHTKEPVYVEHRNGNAVTGYSWHAVQKRLHPQLATSYEFGVRHVEGPWDSVQEARDKASDLYERGAAANFIDKIPHQVSSEIKQTDSGEQYQEVHYLDPNSREPIVTAYKEPGATPVHNRDVMPYRMSDSYTKDFDHSKLSTIAATPQSPYDAYKTAVGLVAMNAAKPFALKLHANDAHSVYKTAKDPEDASALHEKTLLAKHKDAIIKRHSSTAFEMHRRKGGGVIHSFVVPGQIHEIDGGPMNVADGSLTAPD